MNPEYISKYRSEIMGVAIIWIVFFHSKIIFDDSFFGHILNLINTTGYGGADIFFFLSGFSLTYGSLKLNRTISEFYKRRFIRIIPSYLLIAIAYFIVHCLLLKDVEVRNFVLDFSGMNFLFSKNYNWWFVPSIAIFYLLYPLVISTLKKRWFGVKSLQKVIEACLISFLIPILISLFLILIKKNVLVILSSRLSSFLVGIYISFITYQNTSLNNKNPSQLIVILKTFVAPLMCLAGFSLVLFFISFSDENMAWKYGFWWYPFAFLSYPLSQALAYVFHIFDRILGKKNILSSLLSFCGMYSYELYLTHSFIFSLDYLIVNEGSTFMHFVFGNTFIVYTFLSIVSVLFAFIIHFILKNVLYKWIT